MPSTFRSLALRRAVGPILAAALLAGCGMSEKAGPTPGSARRVKDLRREADDCLARFKKSRGQALEELECFAEKHRQTIEIYTSPELCPLCYLNYGYALRLLGRYYVTLREAAERQLEGSAAAEAERLRRIIASARAKERDYFQRSIENLDAYLGTGRILYPQVYDWSAQQHAALGEYTQALRKLDRYIDTLDARQADGSRRSALARRRQIYLKHLEAEAPGDSTDEGRDASSGPAAPANRAASPGGGTGF